MSQIHVIRREIDKIKKNAVNTTCQHIEIDYENFSFTIPNYSDRNQDKKYFPSNTGLKFHQDNSFWRHLMGPFGSGKTTMTMAEVIFTVCRMPKCKDGIRRARVAIIRNTTPDRDWETSIQY